ncbi:hypothetical protein LQ757_13050 [Agromyces sp. SYSU K20354]|uniref:hypothetical protein n=1 Tax=Agromyces cavernae TaxID=2898659 RepID=UPI001E523C41|nr:hypothetical protein [Agromyces cavernae]MCD2443204.1 hypothetical protein [Agromyces cavernae]
MADFMHDLPLSWRPRRDESDVTGDWRDAVAEILDVAATQLDAAEVGDATREWLATDFLRAASSRRLKFAEAEPESETEPEPEPSPEPAAAHDADAGRPAQGPTAQGPTAQGPVAAPPADRLRAAAVMSRNARAVPVRVLARVVAAYLVLAREIDAAPTIASRTSGAVALYLAAKAPTPIRAVINGHTLRARDADWDFGRGPVLEADAVPMLEFLLGRSDSAPRPAPRSAPGTSGY